MEFREYLPFWKELTDQQQAKLESTARNTRLRLSPP